MRNQEIRMGDLELTRSDVSNAIKILLVTKEPKLMYEYLESKGDRYAKLANSVVKGDSLSGAFALNYLDEAILEHVGVQDEFIIERIRYDMAIAYAQTLKNRFEDGKDVIYGDINHIEAKLFHSSVFSYYNLPSDAWTLEPVFFVLPREKRESYWQRALNSVGDIESETLLSINTKDIMFRALYQGPAHMQPKIHSWIKRVMDIDNVVDGVVVTAKKSYQNIISHIEEDNMDRINTIIYNTGNPLIDRGTERFSFWDYPSQHLESFQVQTDWRGETEFTHENPLSEYYLERPDYILPETGLFDSPPIKHPHNMVDKSILENTYPKAEPNRQLAPLTTDLLDKLKINEKPVATNHYLERPSVVLPGTPGFKNFPKETMKNTHHFENMVGQLSDNMSSMNNSMGSFDDKYSMPRMPSIPEFSYSGYSGGGSFSFN